MKISVSQFIDFAYGDKRKDKATVSNIMLDLEVPYDPAKDRYKQFREAMTSFEERKTSLKNFQSLYLHVAANKSSGYKKLSKNYLDMKEDHALVWEGRSPIEVDISGLRIATAWYLRTEESNQKRIIFLHFGKEPFSREKERGVLAVLRLAKTDATGVGILNIQPGTLLMSTRLDETDSDYLHKRAARFVEIARGLKKSS